MTTRDFISNFKKNTGRLPSQVELSKNLSLSHQKAIQALIAYTREITPEPVLTGSITKEKANIIILVLRVALILLSIMAFGLSVYFTGLWFSDRFHKIVAGTISLTMVLFMVISPQALRFIENRLIKAVVVLSFTIALIFSMSSTIAGQYQKTSDRIEAEPDKAFIFDQLQDNEQEVKDLIEEAQKDKSVHQNTISMLSVTEEARKENWQSIATERKYIAGFDQRIDSLREELKIVRSTQIDSGVVEEKRDFYLFISGLTGMEKSFTEFLISSLPAIFIDIISALCLNLALFIKEKK